ncbi:WXG100 family type VII secretion target [Rhodococcus sp. NPDC058521]|uniref:WXG100 family type VII secretion target n=1 Tax=Rhodococcus sp. NPDC058521 TaxID=3346536 RepID=UPI00365D9A39
MSLDPSTTNPLVERGTDVRNNYYQEDIVTHSNLGLPGENGTGYMTGITSFEAGWQLADGIDNGDVVTAASGAIGVGLDAYAAASDPIGYVAAQTLSWMLDHIEPARSALDRVAGNPAMVKAYAQSWRNVETELMSVREDMKSAATSGTTGWTGAASDAYRNHAEAVADLSGGAAGAAHGISVLTESMSEVVAGVRTAIRDLLTGIAGALISWTIEITCTVGIATPVVVAQATSRIAQVVRTVGKLLTKLAKLLGEATTYLASIRDLFDGLHNSLHALQEG